MNIKTKNPNNKIKGSGIYYGYIVLIACFFIMALVYGSQTSFGVFFKPISNDLDWTRAGTSGAFALNMIVSGFLGIVAGDLSDRFGPRKIVTLGCLVLGAGYLLCSTINNLWQLYLYFGILVAVGQSAIYVSLLAVLARWFTRQRGLMSGIGISGLGFGIGVIPIFASYLITSFTWRPSFLILGAIDLILLILFAQLLRKGPRTTVLADNSQNDIVPVKRREFSLKEALKTRLFWIIFVAWFFYGAFSQVGMIHIVPYATDLGMAAVAAASLLTIMGIIGTFGRVGLGFMADRFSNKKTIYVSFALMAVSFIGLVVSYNLGILYGFAVIFGLLSGCGILLGSTVAEYFGLKGLGSISGAIILAYSIGGAVGPFLAGGIFDATGSYQLAFLSCGISGLVSAFIIWLLKPTSRS